MYIDSPPLIFMVMCVTIFAVTFASLRAVDLFPSWARCVLAATTAVLSSMWLLPGSPDSPPVGLPASARGTDARVHTVPLPYTALAITMLCAFVMLLVSPLIRGLIKVLATRHLHRQRPEDRSDLRAWSECYHEE